MATSGTGIYGALYGTGTDSVALQAGSTCGGYPLDPVTKQINVAAGSTSLTMTMAADAERRILIQPTGGLLITLPAPTGSGSLYQICVAATITGGSCSIDAKGSDSVAIFAGVAWQNKTGTGLTTTPTASNTNLITLNGTTSGGIVGDVITIQDAALHTWNLDILGQYTGTFASPFSNH